MVAFSSGGGEGLPPIPEEAPLPERPQNTGMASLGGGLVRLFFAVDVETLQSNEFVMVCGSVDDLGRWDANSSLRLLQDPLRPNRWKGEITTVEATVKFRYFVAYKLFGDNGERTIISRWECFRIPRVISISAEQRMSGVCRESFVDLFGYYSGQRRISEGWLQHEEENQILLRIHGNALKFYNTAKARKNCRIKITPLDVRKKIAGLVPPKSSGSDIVDEEEEEDDNNTMEPFPSHSESAVALLSSSVSPRFTRQPATGVVFNNNVEYLMYKTHSVAVEFLAFFVEIFSDEGKRIGSCYALPSSLSDSFGSTYLPFINSAGRPQGQICVEYLFIRKLKRAVPFQSMETSFARHWKKRNTLEVGHRGAGNSYTKMAATRENTINSLNTAAKNGADYVEFDVQLSKDKIAVIYHDFHVLVSVTKRGQVSTTNGEGIDYHEIAVKDLKLSQIKLLMLDHVSKKLMPGRGTIEPELDDYKPFPTLVEALAKVDPDVGFNVEVKYPMMQTNGEHECEHYFERNDFVDVILADILNAASGRRIVFSSFDPDICQMISMKQNQYPVLFLCVGTTQRYTPFSDQRTSTSLTAVNFAASADLLGVNFNSEDLLNDPYPVQRASDLGLVNFVWGDDLDKKETIDYFKKSLGVDGLIYDRIGEDETRTNVFIVEREQKKALFMYTVGTSGTSTPRASSPTDSIKSYSSAGHNTSTQKNAPLLTEVNNLRIQTSPRIQQC